MNKLLGAELCSDEVVFAHIKGRRVRVTIRKETCLGYTLSDNGAGYVFIKRIQEGGTLSRKYPEIEAGDHIEQLEGKSVIGCTHADVATALKVIADGTTFTLSIVKPLKSNENESHLNKNDRHLNDNDSHLYENDIHLNGNDSHLNKNESHLNETYSHLNPTATDQKKDFDAKITSIIEHTKETNIQKPDISSPSHNVKFSEPKGCCTLL